MRAEFTPGARAQCETFGFAPGTPVSLDRCVESQVSERIEERYGWQRMKVSGLNHTGSEEMQAISRCIADGTYPPDPRFSGCFAANRHLAIQAYNDRANARRQRSLDRAVREAEIRALTAPRRCVTRRVGNTTYTDCN